MDSVLLVTSVIGLVCWKIRHKAKWKWTPDEVLMHVSANPNMAQTFDWLQETWEAREAKKAKSVTSPFGGKPERQSGENS
ncbi:unnamed protein product [Penicillium salamii]|nr:unnamed protein product [Penicillium salamii]CAG8105313.1 unnamed protein product [Penicillium salamii]